MPVYRAIILSLLLAFGATNQSALAQSNTEEAGAGAAAVSVVAWRCQPEQFESVSRQAFERLALQLREHPPVERERVFDSAQRKLRALSIANEKIDCASLGNLRLMAQTWGYGHLLGAR